MLFNVLLILGGFVLLIGGADYLVKGASSFAKGLGIRTFVIGLTVVAFGTSAPELAVNLFSSAEGASGLAVGNIFGSNIANILLILGVTAIITPITVQKGTIWKEIPFSMLAAVVLVVLGSDVALNMSHSNFLTRADGIIFLSFFIIFMYYTYGISRVTGKSAGKIQTFPSWKTAVYILGGIAALMLGGRFIVDGSVFIAKIVGISDHLIGLTVVAIGTSLPELATSIVAALKGHTDIAVGNVVGSNIFNILFVLGTTAVVFPIPYDSRAFQDGLWLLAISSLLMLGMFVGARYKLDRWKGIMFLAIYVVYIAASIMRG